MINIILIGAPGAGKGTQANRLLKKYNLTYISTGDIIRDEIKNNTCLGKKAKLYSNKGLLVPDELVTEIIENKLQLNKSGFLLDGYPRNIKQAILLDEIIKLKNITQPFIFYIDVPEGELIKRLTNRLYCPNCNRVYNLVNNVPRNSNICDICSNALVKRNDDNIEIIKKRIEVFFNDTYPLLDYYGQCAEFFKINGDYSEEEVYKQIVVKIDDNIEK
jgi:adenylate kinase